MLKQPVNLVDNKAVEQRGAGRSLLVGCNGIFYGSGVLVTSVK